MSDNSAREADLVSFSERLAGSQVFSTLFREGMNLVEETASYLDGSGRKDAKALDRTASLTYATESMRLTTRLMQLASWLLLHRAVKEGEMSLAQANREKVKVKLTAAEPGAADAVAMLPARLAGFDRALDGAAGAGKRLDVIDPRAGIRDRRCRQSAGAAAQQVEGCLRAAVGLIVARISAAPCGTEPRISPCRCEVSAFLRTAAEGRLCIRVDKKKTPPHSRSKNGVASLAMGRGVA